MGKEEKRMALSSKIASSKLTQNQLFLLKALLRLMTINKIRILRQTRNRTYGAVWVIS